MDRYHRGLVAGMIAGIPMNIWDLISYHYLYFSKLRYLDWSSVTIFGHLPKSNAEIAFALASHFFWVGFLGMIFAFLMGEKITSRKYWLKGLEYGYIVGFLIYAAGIAFKMPEITMRTAGTAVSQFIGGSIWGLTLAFVLAWLDTTPLVKE